jgi:hypothetical protein
VTEAELHALKADAVEKYATYIDSEIKLWEEKNGFANLKLYKAFKRAKTAFYVANGKREEALLEYVSDSFNRPSGKDSLMPCSHLMKSFTIVKMPFVSRYCWLYQHP